MFKSLFSKTDAVTPVPVDGSPRKKILVVDDNRVVLKVIRQMLSGTYEVVEAEDGAEAVAAARQQNPSLILLDLNFPIDPMSGPLADGFDVFRWIRQTLKIESVPFIIVSDTDPAVYQDRFEKGQIAACFKKPLNKKELLAAIESAIRENERPA